MERTKFSSRVLAPTRESEPRPLGLNAPHFVMLSAQYSPRPRASLLEKDAETIALSGYAFSYTVGTKQLVSARLASVLKSLERLKEPTRNFTPPPGASRLGPSPILRQTASFVNLQDRQDVTRASTALFKKNRIENYISCIKEAFELPAAPSITAVPLLNVVQGASGSLSEIMSMPYIDVSANRQNGRPSLLRRSTSFATIPLVEQALSQPDATCEPTPVAGNNQANAVFTTSTSEPFAIRSLNDLACLMFGLAQNRAVGTSMFEFIDPHMHDHVRSKLSSEAAIPLSGELVDIVKTFESHPIQSIASFWVERSGNNLVWVVEEINMRLVQVSYERDGSLSLPPPFTAKHAREIHPELLSSTETLVHSTISAFDRELPVLASHSQDHIKLRFPYVVGAALVLDPQHNILAANRAAIFNMLGLQAGSLVGKHMDAIVPEFSAHMDAIHKIVPTLTTGTVVPEHMFRQVAGQKSDFFQEFPFGGVVAKTAGGSNLFVDIELRILGPHIHVLWLTFARPTFDTDVECVVPSQLELLRVKSTTSNSTLSSPATPRSGLRLSVPTTPNAVTPESLTPLEGVLNFEVSKKAPAKAQQQPPPSLPKVPTASIKVGARRRELTMDDFSVQRSLGEGAYGRVVLALPKDAEPGSTPVIIKSIFKDRILVDTWTRDRSLGTIPNEIKILNELRIQSHPNITCLIDFFEDSKHFHIETELHGNPAIDLFDFIESNELAADQCKQMFLDIASAVAHLHGLGIVHRDIKDENIIVDEQGVCQLIDFGSAAYTRKGPFDVFVGTVDYAAPEVLEGNPFEGPPQDVWALGVLLYTMIYKENPFSNVDEILSGEVNIPQDVDADLTNLIEKILVPNFRERPKVQWIVEQLQSERQ